MDNIDDIDFAIEPELLFGLPIKYKELTIYPYTIKDVIQFGLQDYNQIVGILSLEKEEIEDKFSIYDINVYELVIIIFYNDNIFRDKLLRFFSKLLNTTIYFHADNYFITEDFIKIEESDFYNIINILLQQNMISRKKYQIKSKKEKEYLELVKKAKEKYKKFLDNDNDTFLLDIISSVCAKHPSLNLFNIEYLTLYQLYNQFRRLSYIDEYSINIQSMLAGASNINLEHWSRKIINK
jgi:hypothetical protein